MASQRTAERVTEKQLVHGWASAPRVRVRQARAADMDAVGEIAAIAQVPFEMPVREAMVEGIAGAGLRVGLRSGPEGFLRYMAERFHAHRRTNPMAAYLESALVLVAEHRDQGVVGGLIAYPPISVAEEIVDTVMATGAPEREWFKTLMIAGMFLIRIKGLAVAEHARGAHIGGSLLKRCRQVYFQCDYQTIYGAMPATPGLDQFYRRAGFTVHDFGQPLDLSLMFDMPTHIGPAPGERIFHRDRPRSA